MTVGVDSGTLVANGIEVTLGNTSAAAYWGAGAQDVKNRISKRNKAKRFFMENFAG